MREKLQQRLDDLKAEFEKGQTKLQDIQQQQIQLHETLLRIGGAIQVLTELLEEDTKNQSSVPVKSKSE
ncbi:MAG: hypothetical protein Q8L02_00825 [Candidatus Nitrotoga sp.]|nr:hypothetical protein [Candidatus Nitrotoga sp.]